MAQAVVRAQVQVPAEVLELEEGAELVVVAVPVAALEAPAAGVELALEAEGRELAAEVAEAAQVPVVALEAEELAVADPVAGRVWAAEPVLAEERQHLVSG